MRYLSQRYTAPNSQVKGVLNDVGTEELGHMEMICAIVYQLTRNMSIEEIKKSGFDAYYVDHTTGLYPVAASGPAFTATYFQSKGDPITDLTEDLAAEQKARTTYDNILRLVDDQEVRDPIKFLRAREVVHFQRFGEALRITQEQLDSKNFYAFNPSFDVKGARATAPNKSNIMGLENTSPISDIKSKSMEMIDTIKDLPSKALMDAKDFMAKINKSNPTNTGNKSFKNDILRYKYE